MAYKSSLSRAVKDSTFSKASRKKRAAEKAKKRVKAAPRLSDVVKAANKTTGKGARRTPSKPIRKPGRTGEQKARDGGGIVKSANASTGSSSQARPTRKPLGAAANAVRRQAARKALAEKRGSRKDTKSAGKAAALKKVREIRRRLQNRD